MDNLEEKVNAIMEEEGDKFGLAELAVGFAVNDSKSK